MCTALCFKCICIKRFWSLLQLKLKFKQISASILAPLGGSNWPWKKWVVVRAIIFCFIAFILKELACTSFKRRAQQSKCLSANWKVLWRKSILLHYSQMSSYKLARTQQVLLFSNCVVLTIEIIWLPWFCVCVGIAVWVWIYMSMYMRLMFYTQNILTWLFVFVKGTVIEWSSPSLFET